MEYAGISRTAEVIALVVIFSTLRPLVTAQSRCGTVKSSFTGSDAYIRLVPDRQLADNKVLMHGRTYRWIKAKDGDYTGISINHRIKEENFTLKITDFGPPDVGTYYVQCQSLTGTTIESSRLYVTSPDVIPQTSSTSTSTFTSTSTTSSTLDTTPPWSTTTVQYTSSTQSTTQKYNSQGPLGQSKNTGSEFIDSSVAIIVVSTCVVIIVVVVSGTIVLVCRRRKQKEVDHQRLTEMTTSSMACRGTGDGESVYNEIDLRYDISPSKTRVTEFSGSRELLASPTLPRRPVPAGKNGGTLSEKSTNNVYSTPDNATKVSPKSTKPSPDPTLTVDVKSMYASVVPKKYRINKDVSLPPEYINAKPVLRKDVDQTDAADGACTEQYSVMFPKIEISSINTKMGDTKSRADLVSMTEENFAAVCRDGVYRSQKRKSGRKLNYVEIDHSGAATVAAVAGGDILVRDFVKAPQEKLEYSSIDFEKKAFVAPARRAPSSWYKRRNKKKRY